MKMITQRRTPAEVIICDWCLSSIGSIRSFDNLDFHVECLEAALKMVLLIPVAKRDVAMYVCSGCGGTFPVSEMNEQRRCGSCEKEHKLWLESL